MKKRVMLAMSGGVDSTAAAILLKKQGYTVIGVTMQLLHDQNTAIEDAQKVCQKLEIEHHVIDCISDFEKYVIQPFIKSYQKAETPNPCIECNKHLKFGLLYQESKKLNCTYIATGHYARSMYSSIYQTQVIKKAVSQEKDQSYVLYGISKEMIPYILFPLGVFKTKEEIREIVKQEGMNIYSKKDSQEICFIPNNNYGEFIERQVNINNKVGNIIDKKGNILGKHKGLIHYTIGQRKGISISAKTPLYIIEINKESNTIVVGEEKDIYQKELYANNVNFLLPFVEGKKVKAKIRYSAKEAEAQIYKQTNNTIKVEFTQVQRAITPGQAVVFYVEDDILLGGGTILK